MMPKGARTTEAPERANDLPEWYVTPEQAKAEGITYIVGGGFFCRLSDGGLVEFVKPEIETSFCFGYGICGTYEDALKSKANAKEDYFLRENLRGIDDRIKELKSDDILFIYCNAANIEVSRNWSNTPLQNWKTAMMNDTDRARLLEAYKLQRAKFEKRLHAYLKRYGVSKVKKFTHFEL